jgi:DNA repair protein RadD
MLREYQQLACDAALDYMRTTTSPCLIDAAPAAGKSHMIAYIADRLHAISGGKRILCLAPNAKLVNQNREKMQATGHPSSIFSASAGAKSTKHNIIFGTPGTVINAISRFNDGSYCAVVIDECHGVTPTIRAIIEAMRLGNPNLRVMGLTGTPYILGKGYIYRQQPNGRVHGEEVCRDPYFTRCVYRVSAREMLDAKYITPMTVGEINAQSYDTSGVVLLPNGHLDTATVERAFVGHGRQTAHVVADVVAQAQHRTGGVMLFAATVAHAHEIMASLPPGNSVLVTGDMSPADEKAAVLAYRNHKKRYVVSVGKLTTGFDSPWTEIIAVLRYTESATLLTQILGRAWRLFPGKTDCLWLDYAGNHERHFPDGDIYNPTIKAGKAAKEGEGIQAECPACGYENAFSATPDGQEYKLDKHGYCLDVFGERIETDYGPMPGHFGRRCNGLVKVGPEYDRCGYYWTSKDCEACGEKNDIAARFCRSCKAEIINPNDRLVMEFEALKKDPHAPQTDVVLSMTTKESISQKGNPTVRVDWVTPHRKFSVWFQKEATHPRAAKDWRRFQEATAHGQPETVSYLKEAASSFFRILGYNNPVDTLESLAA